MWNAAQTQDCIAIINNYILQDIEILKNLEDHTRVRAKELYKLHLQLLEHDIKVEDKAYKTLNELCKYNVINTSRQNVHFEVKAHILQEGLTPLLSEEIQVVLNKTPLFTYESFFPILKEGKFKLVKSKIEELDH